VSRRKPGQLFAETSLVALNAPFACFKHQNLITEVIFTMTALRVSVLSSFGTAAWLIHLFV
jgi:hypothetical protein